MQPDSPIAEVLARATDLLKSGQTDQAFALLEQLVSDQPDLAIGWYLLGYLALSIGDVESAIPLLEKSLSLDIRHADSQLSLCQAYFAAGRIEDAAHLYDAMRPATPAVMSALLPEMRTVLDNVLRQAGA